MLTRQLFSLISLLFFTLLHLGCSLSATDTHPLFEYSDLSTRQQIDRLILTGVKDKTALIQEVERLGLKIHGHEFLEISGPQEKLAKIQISKDESPTVIQDKKIFANRTPTAHKPDEKVYYLAKRDFNLPNYWKKHPSHDGRGVRVGVIDDGISPYQSGFQKTTTNERKFLMRNSNSSFYEIQLKEMKEKSAFAASFPKKHDTVFEGEIDETEIDYIDRLLFPQSSPFSRIVTFPKFFDLNGDFRKTKISLAVFQHSDTFTVCIDSKLNHAIDSDECFKTFKEHGEFGFWDQRTLRAIMADFDPSKKTLRISQGEGEFDGHGEGVASVVSGHLLGGKFSGVAPGSQILDYDINEATPVPTETVYTMSTFFRALDWLGANGAQVVNISYHFFFVSPETQRFAKAAFEHLIKKYKFIVCFAAGNYGPGLGSFNAGLIYPKDSLVVGAFMSRDLGEYVYGLPNLPDPGRVIYYSNRGPAPDRGSAPTLIGPLASISHSTPGKGYRSFGGTSSATPALAGLAAVLISAIQQKGWPFDHKALIHALRQSAKPLENVAFIEQGAGLPKVGKALNIYKQIIEGHRVTDISAVFARTGSEPISLAGVFEKFSELTDYTEYTYTLTGTLSDLVKPKDATNFFQPIDIEYSHTWMEGPSKLYVSIGQSQAYLGIDTQKLRQEPEFQPGAEFLGEIKIKDQTSKEVLKTIPVTIVVDTPATQPLQFSKKLEVVEGKRFHLHVPKGTIGLLMSSKTSTKFTRAGISTSLYNPQGNKSGSQWIFDQEEMIHFPTSFSGWHQLTFSRLNGVKKEIDIDFSVSPVVLGIDSKMVSIKDSRLSIENNHLPIDGTLTIRQQPDVLYKNVSTVEFAKPVQHTLTDLKKGIYRIEVTPTFKSSSNNNKASCFVEIQDKAKGGGKIFERYFYTPVFYVNDQFKGGSLSYQCYMFEHNERIGKKRVSITEQVIFRPEKDAGQNLANFAIELDPGYNQLQIPWEKVPSESFIGDVYFTPEGGYTGFRVGEIQFLK